jgi:hypothetical protein
MPRSTLTIHKNKNGRITSIKATGVYARSLFDSLKPVTVAIPEKVEDEHVQVGDQRIVVAEK